MGLDIEDLLDCCKERKNYILMLHIPLEGLVVPMYLDYYVADEIVHFLIDKENSHNFSGQNFIDEMEKECLTDDWGSIYVSPMEHLGHCEARFVNSFDKYADEYYEIENIGINDGIEVANDKTRTIDIYVGQPIEQLENKENVATIPIDEKVEKLIFGDNTTVGKACDLKKYLMNCIGDLAKEVESDYEDIIDTIELYTDTISDLEENYLNNDVVMLKDNPMGGFDVVKID